MKKKWIALGTTLVMTAVMAIPAMAAIDYVTARLRPDYTIVIDGKEQTFRTSAGEKLYPLLYDGSVYLSLRAIGQIVNKEVTWNNATKTVTLTSEGFTATDADPFKGTDIDLEKAKEIALAHAGLKESEITHLRAERNRDIGILKYDVEFQKGRMEYDYEIHAETGKILKAEKDYDD